MNENKIKKHSIFFSIFYIIIILCVCYMLFSYVRIFFKNHVNIYQVENGSLKKEESFRGFIYRDEQVLACEKSGYCSLIYTDGKKVSKDSIIMIFTDTDYSNINNVKTIDDNDVYDKMIGYTDKLDDIAFYNLYSYHNNIDNYIQDMKSSISTYIDSAAYKDKNGLKVYAKHSGIISYCVDGCEGLDKDNYNSDMLMYKNYKDNVYKRYYEKGDKVGKLITKPYYYIVFDSDSELIKNYIDKKVKIKIENNSENIECVLSTYETNDGLSHYILKGDKYLEEFLNFRVVDFSIVYKESFGMKIPNACVFKRNCFQIEKEYVENSELDNNYYIYKLDDKKNKKQYKVDISFADDDYYYVLYDENNNILNINDKITYHDKVYNLSVVKSFEGVFCINKGYKMFKIIKVLDKNNEYSIIDRNARTALREYDILVLNVDF